MSTLFSCIYASHKARLEIGTGYLPSSPKFTEMQQLTEVLHLEMNTSEASLKSADGMAHVDEQPVSVAEVHLHRW